MFSTLYCTNFRFYMHLKMSSAITGLNLDQSKFLLSGKGLIKCFDFYFYPYHSCHSRSRLYSLQSIMRDQPGYTWSLIFHCALCSCYHRFLSTKSHPMLNTILFSTEQIFRQVQNECISR